MTEQTVEQQQAEFKEAVAQALHDLLNIPANQLSLAIMMAQSNLNSLVQQRNEEQRRYTQPVLVRAPYKGCIKATIGDVDAEGLLTVLLEEEKDGVWVESQIDPVYQATFKKLALSDTAQPGDIWFITTPAAIDAEREKATDYFEAQMRAGEVKEEATAPVESEVAVEVTE